MQVRPAAIVDSGPLGRGMKQVVDEGIWLATEAEASEADLAARFRLALEDGHPVFVLEAGDELIGCVGLHPAGPEGVLSLGMWILAPWRGRGGGRMLIDAALAGRPADTHKVELEVFPENEAAIGLYETAGFEREGLRRDHYRRRDGSLRSAVIMARLFRED